MPEVQGLPAQGFHARRRRTAYRPALKPLAWGLQGLPLNARAVIPK